MARSLAVAMLAILPFGAAQQIGRTPEVHPKLSTQYCTKKHGCVTQKTAVVLDALSHPIENTTTGASCETSACSSAQACAHGCALEGVNYAQHGVQANGDSLTLHQYLDINGTETSVSPRLYLLGPNGKNYENLKLLNQEISFTVDVSNLPCGMNGALYLSAMDASGGRSNLNPAGATYGTGYCDAQCPKSAWINGVANIDNHGACCNEMDLWEANAVATQLTPHACNITGLYECTGAACGSTGVCDESGCGINPYTADHTFYGYHDTVDTTKPLTVVTQFYTNDNTASGTLNQIRRLYVQNGKVIQNANVTFDGGERTNSITNAYCNATAPSFQQRGGLAQMGDALGRGMVLIFSIWNDQGGYMNWLDSGNAGPCNATEGNPTLIIQEDPTTSVTFSNVKWVRVSMNTMLPTSLVYVLTFLPFSLGRDWVDIRVCPPLLIERFSPYSYITKYQPLRLELCSSC